MTEAKTEGQVKPHIVAKSKERILRERRAKLQREPNKCSGGIRIPKSPCCGASINRTTGGVVLENCSRCGGSVSPQHF